MSGTGTFAQTGGTNTVAGNLNLSYNVSSRGSYALSGNAVLSASGEYIGYYTPSSALFQQTGGSNSTSYLSIASGGKYFLGGGTMQLAAGGGFVNSGTLDCGNANGVLDIVGSSIFDLSQGTLQNTGSAFLNLGPNSLLIVPTGMNPATAFGQYSDSNTALLYTRGTPLTVSSGQAFSGAGTIHDRVTCQGSITATAGPINLSAGMILSGTGAVNLGSGTLTSKDSTSGIAGGSLVAGSQYLATTGTGIFTQSDGSSSISYLSIGSGGRYLLTGGTLQFPATGVLANSGTLDGGNSPGNLVFAGSSIVDLSQGSVVHAGSTSLNVGPNSLLIVPASMNPTTAFGSYLNAGLIYTRGTTLTVPAGQGFSGNGTISDPVVCQGTINAIGGSIAFASGLTVSGNGSINFGSQSLTTDNISSGLSGGSISAGNQFVGYSGLGSFTQSGGTNVTSGGTASLFVGYMSGSRGIYNLSGNSLLMLTQVWVGYQSGSGGTCNLSGNGFLISTAEYLGTSGESVFTQTGGTNSVASYLDLSDYSGSSGTYNLNGGLLKVGNLMAGSGTAQFNFSGGTLQTLSSFTTSLPISLAASGGIGTIDTCGNAVTFSGQFSGPGGLAKAGSGTLFLSSSNSYSGGIAINAGTVNFVAGALGTETITMGGGTLQWASGNTQDVSRNLATIGAGAIANLDTNGNNVTFAYGLSGSGSLTKKGNGNLTFASGNTYSGTTTINSGSLYSPISQRDQKRGGEQQRRRLGFCKRGQCVQFSKPLRLRRFRFDQFERQSRGAEHRLR